MKGLDGFQGTPLRTESDKYGEGLGHRLRYFEGYCVPLFLMLCVTYLTTDFGIFVQVLSLPLFLMSRFPPTLFVVTKT